MATFSMTYYELEFKFQHDCPYNELSKRNPKAVIAFWCSWSKHVLEISYSDVDTFEGIQADLEDIGEKFGATVIRKTFGSNNLQLVLTECACNKNSGNVTSLIEKNNCLELAPEIYTGGWEHYRIIAFSQRDVRRLFDQLAKIGELQIVSRKAASSTTFHENFIISTSSLVGGLTKRQQDALLAAIDYGYYRVPKRAKTEEIAARLGVPRTTYEEHLRKAESKVLSAVAPYVKMPGREA